MPKPPASNKGSDCGGGSVCPDSECMTEADLSKTACAECAARVEADSAQPYTGAADMTPKSPPKGGAGGMIVLLAVIVLIGLILWWLL